MRVRTGPDSECTLASRSHYLHGLDCVRPYAVGRRILSSVMYDERVCKDARRMLRTFTGTRIDIGTAVRALGDSSNDPVAHCYNSSKG